MILETRWQDLAAQLRRSLDEDAFELYCQPIASLRDLVLAYPIGEIFIRRRAEEEALRAPGGFLPAMKEYGLMPALDRWVVRQALQRLAAGSTIGRFSINISRETIADRTFPDFLADELHATGVPAACLWFEIEESDALAARQATPRFVAMVTSLGSHVAIDGFGATPGCGDILAMSGIALLKLTSTLTQQMVADAPDQRWRMLVREVPRLGVQVLAACVEDADAVHRLRALNVHYAQGFGLHRPRPVDSFCEGRLQQVA